MPIWFFVLIVCFTGMLAVVSQEIVWLADPAVRANKPDADTERMSFQQVLEALNRAEPDMVVERLSQPDGSHFAVKANVTLPDGTRPTLYVNPYTGTIQGKTPDFNFEAFTRALHGWWLVPFTNGFSWAGTWSRCSACRCWPRWSPVWWFTRSSGKAFSNPCVPAMVREFSGVTCTVCPGCGQSGSLQSFPSPAPGS